MPAAFWWSVLFLVWLWMMAVGWCILRAAGDGDDV